MFIFYNYPHDAEKNTLIEEDLILLARERFKEESYSDMYSYEKSWILMDDNIK